MKNRIFMAAVVLSATLCWPTSWSIENPGIGNPVGPSTVPLSTFRSSLVNNPSPIDTSGNLLITGNVRRGRHFRGDVPYRSATSFGSSLGSSALSSFLRDTAGSEDLKTYYNKYGTQPYYSPTETVTTMMPGRSEIFRPTSTRMSTRAQQDTRSAGTGVSGLEFRPKEQTLFRQGAPAADSGLQGLTNQYGPLAQSLDTKYAILDTRQESRIKSTGWPSPNQVHRMAKPKSRIEFREQVQDIRDRTQSTGWPSTDSTTVLDHGSTESLSENNTSFQYLNQDSSTTSREFQTGQGQIAAGTIETLERTRGDTSGLTGTGRDREQGDVLERIRQQLEDLTKALDATIQRRDEYKDVSTKPVAKQEEKPLGYQQYVPDSRQAVPRERINSSGILNSYKPHGAEIGFNGEELAPAARGGLNRADNSRQTGLEFTGIPNYDNSQKRSSPLKELDKLSQADISAKAKRIMGPHSSHESLSGFKFNQHMREAEEHLNAGRYYRAASCFSLASVYQADNPLALAGRGHALFAAGEYVSSALFLSRALAVSPEYLLMKVDLVAMLGDENKLAGRIADIEQWLARSGSSQLQFLLGYVYYRTGQLHLAKQAIDAAYEKTPESPAVQAMKIAIDNI